MSLSNAFEDAYLQHIYQNAAIAGVGDASGLQPSAAAGSLYIGLAESDPGEAGDQTTGETDYAGYARQAVARSGAEWDVTNGVASNINPVNFPQATSAGTGTGILTHFTIGTDLSGAGLLIGSGALNNPITISPNVTTPTAGAGVITHTVN